jgi:hypothetical protein
LRFILSGKTSDERAVERVSVSAFVDPDDHELLVERARSEDRSVLAEPRLGNPRASVLRTS